MASTIRQQLFGGGHSSNNHNISTSDQEEDFISIKPRFKKKYTLAVKQPGTQDTKVMEASSEVMEAIVVVKEAKKPPGSSKVGKAAAEKRPRDDSSSEVEGVLDLESILPPCRSPTKHSTTKSLQVSN